MMNEPIELKDIKNKADVDKYLFHECTADGLATSVSIALCGDYNFYS